MIPGEHTTPKGALSAMLPVLWVLLVLFAAVVQANHAQGKKIETAEPRVFSLLSCIRDPLSGNPNCGSGTGSPLLRTEFCTAILDSRLTAKRPVLILAKYAPGD